MKNLSKSRLVRSWQKTWDEYCGVCSVHGLKYFKDKDTNIYLRCLWIVTVLAMVVLANYMASSLFFSFIEEPVKIIIETDHAISADILFPAVTVCPGSMYNHTKALNIIQNLTLPNGVSVLDVVQSLGQMYAFTETNFQLNTKKLDILTTVMKYNNYTMIEFLGKSIWDCSAFFFRCRFLAKIKNCSEIFYYSKTHAGLCCSFNFIQSSNHSVMYNSERHGVRQGLSIILKDVDLYMNQNNSNSRRFQIFIHRSSAYPDIATFRKILHRNEEVLLKFDPTETTLTPEVWKRLNVDERKCTLLIETELETFSNYNRQNCVSECKSFAILRECGCVPFNMFSNPSSLVCSFEHIPCVLNYYDRHVPFRSKKCQCEDCCDKVEFAVYLASAKIDRTIETTDPFYDNLPSNSTIVNIYLRSQEYRRLRRDIVWNIVSLAGNMGNCYGVFVGISAISVLELLYYLTFVMRRNYQNTFDHQNKELFRRRMLT